MRGAASFARMQGGLEQLIAAEQRLDDLVVAGDHAARALVDKAKQDARAGSEKLVAAIAQRCLEIERRAVETREQALSRAEQQNQAERDVFDHLDEDTLEELAVMAIDRVLTSLEREVER
jgi:hypothetical protein